jgi:peptidoglycan hydrolase CwlO-like protein
MELLSFRIREVNQEYDKMNDTIYTVIITALTVMSSSAAWRFYEKWLAMKGKAQDDAAMTHHLFREDLQGRVDLLETKLTAAENDNSSLQSEIRKLSEVTAALKVEVEFLRKENVLLRSLYEKMGGTLPVIAPTPKTKP